MMNSSLRDRLLAWRDAALSNHRFQRFAASSVLMRGVVRRRAGAMFNIVAGFVYSQILFACVQLRLFDAIADRPASVEELALRLSLPIESMRLLLDAAAALELVQRRSGARYGLGQLGAELRGNPGVMAFVEHHAMLYHDLADPVALLRGDGGGELATYWAYVQGDRPSEDAVASYTTLMSSSQPMVARQVLNAYAFRGHRCLLDIGGGDGTFLATVAAAAPDLRCVLFDLPPVAARAAARFAAGGLSARASAIGGSFLTDPLPQGADIISLVRVIHDHDDEIVIALLKSVFAALPEQGTLLIAEPISGIRSSETITDAYLGFYLKAMGTGRPRSFERLRELLATTGFAEIRLRQAPMPLVASVITAIKPL